MKDGKNNKEKRLVASERDKKMFGKKSEEVPVSFEIFAIYDSKVQAYDEPMFAINQHDLTRHILNTWRNPDQSRNKFLLNAEDYSLFKIGAYSKKAGRIICQEPEHVANLHELRAVLESQKEQRFQEKELN